METIKKYILEYMADKNKPSKVYMEQWKTKHKRPTPDSIIASEIYENTLYSEQDVIKALKELLQEKKVNEVYMGGEEEKIFWHKLA